MLESVFDIPLSRSLTRRNLHILVSVVLVASVVEECAKPIVLSLKPVRRGSDEIEDGFIYGVAAGLGFSATENLLHEWSFISKGLSPFLILVVIRSIACCLLHASATAFKGYGYVRSIIKRRPMWMGFPFFMLAIGVHAFYNFIVFFAIIGGIISIGAALLFAVFCIRFVRREIRKFDRAS